ncbi:type I 3-dehydroquinate dehydratase [Salinigranum salinum]|uniref:type I 3-dehydroquinate dehydratase n=1 Tax=Salinigranum salinum TaxID=1364937 RepID=UPI001863C14D|nr:type I 3-dehydroquinate dehydratase [Salinigranum salinum]
MRLSDLEQPFIVTSLAETTIEETVATIKQAEYDGARAFEVHLPLVSFPDREDVERLTTSTAAPMYATCRREHFYDLLGADVPVELTDDQRTEALVDAVEAGFDGADFELDTFDPTGGPEAFTEAAITAHAADPDAEPAQITDDADAVARQREVVDRVHDAGGDVMLSAHTYTHLTPEDALGIAERATDRGADFAKIVGVDRDMDEALETLRAHLRLNEADVVPYGLMAIGDPSRIVRPIAPMFGSAWVFAQPELTPGGFHSWPLVENAREVLRRVDWRTAYTPHESGTRRP